MIIEVCFLEISNINSSFISLASQTSEGLARETKVLWLSNEMAHFLQLVSPSQFLASPSTFRGVTSLTPSTSGCVGGQLGITCPYGTILGDSEAVPPQPNLENGGGGNSDIGKFLVWPSSTDRPYMTFQFGFGL